MTLHFAILLTLFCSTLCDAQKKPNIVIFLVDDLGIGDIGCFGNDSLKTPNIDKLASEGARLTHNLAPESVCTPSRAAFLTGRYAIRSGLASEPRKLRMFLSNSAYGGLPQNETTFAESLADVGYATGLIGKWHLGLNQKVADDFHFHPLKQGFQYFYGLPLTNLRNCEAGHSLVELVAPNWKRNVSIALAVVALTCLVSFACGILSKRSATLLFLLAAFCYGFLFFAENRMQAFFCMLMRNYDVVEQPLVLENLTARFTDEAISFMDRSKAKPFLLFMSYAKVHTALFTTKAFQGHSGHSRYGDNVEEMDWSVGKIMGALEEFGLKNDTFVYFTSDQGPHIEEVSTDGEYHGGWHGIYKGGKGQSWEGGIRVPTVVTWPSHIPAGIDISEPTCSFDIFPTILRLAGASLPTDRIIDGKDMMPLLKQQEQYSPHEFMYHYCAKAIHAVRYRPRHGKTTWKAHFMTPRWTDGTEGCFSGGLCYCYGDSVTIQDPPLLFDITADPTESHPVDFKDPQYKIVMQKIATALKEHNENVDDVSNQLMYNRMIYFWLQSCCNFPFCKCTEDFKPTKHFPGEL